ncbi:MAG: tetratricopeptide repeat protein [Chromatiales bacterium]|jgi:tetratricopeptide (TPR) repeat protein
MIQALRIGATALLAVASLLTWQGALAEKPDGWVGKKFSGHPCKGRPQGYGPFDYTTPHGREHLAVVERTHFTKGIRTLRSTHGASFIDNIDYTLRAFPNHHKALQTLIALDADKKKWGSRERATFPPVECYFQRAIGFRSKDPTVRALFGIYLHKKGRLEEAVRQYQAAAEISPRNPEIHYNLGLALVGLKRYSEALSHAEEAYEGGYPLPGLKNKLERAGYRVKALDRRAGKGG